MVLDQKNNAGMAATPCVQYDAQGMYPGLMLFNPASSTGWWNAG